MDDVVFWGFCSLYSGHVASNGEGGMEGDRRSFPGSLNIPTAACVENGAVWILGSLVAISIGLFALIASLNREILAAFLVNTSAAAQVEFIAKTSLFAFVGGVVTVFVEVRLFRASGALALLDVVARIGSDDPFVRSWFVSLAVLQGRFASRL